MYIYTYIHIYKHIVAHSFRHVYKYLNQHQNMKLNAKITNTKEKQLQKYNTTCFTTFYIGVGLVYGLKLTRLLLPTITSFVCMQCWAKAEVRNVRIANPSCT